MIDESTRDRLALRERRKLASERVLRTHAELSLYRGSPRSTRSDNAPELTSTAVRAWLASIRVESLFLELGSPWDDVSEESFNGEQRDQLLDGEVFDPHREARVLVERWRWHDNDERPHGSRGYRPPDPEAQRPGSPRSAPALPAGEPAHLLGGPTTHTDSGTASGPSSARSTLRRTRGGSRPENRMHFPPRRPGPRALDRTPGRCIVSRAEHPYERTA